MTIRFWIQPFNHLKKACAQLSADMSKVAGLSIWADGAPYNHDRSKSFEVASLQILTSASSTMRFPVACVPKHWMVKNTTWDAIWQVLKLSLQAAASGVWPAFRHDNSAFAAFESHRKKQEHHCQGPFFSRLKETGPSTRMSYTFQVGMRQAPAVGNATWCLEI